MRRNIIFLVILHTLCWGASLEAQERGVRLLLEPPAMPLSKGTTGTLAITLVDAAGTPCPAEQDLTIQLTTGPDLLPSDSVVLRAGEKRVESALTPSKAGAWVIQGNARGVFGDDALVVCVEETEERSEAAMVETSEVAIEAQPPRSPRIAAEAASTRSAEEPTETASPHTRPSPTDLQIRRLPRRPVAASAVQPAETERSLMQVAGIRPDLATQLLTKNPRVRFPDVFNPHSGNGGDSEVATAQGHLVLKPELSEVRRGTDGLYRSSLHALWFKGESPSPSQQDLALELLFEPATSDRLVEPAVLSLASGMVNTKAEIRSDTAGEVQVVALYDQFTSQPVRVRFLPPRPATLAFTRTSYSLRGLASARLDVVVQLLDNNGLGLFAEDNHKISLSLEGEGGVETHELEIAKGQFQTTAKLRVSRFGEHTLRAISPNLESALATAHLRLDYLMLVVALLGGMVGSVARLLFTRDGKDWKKGMVRALALGVVAALLALLLALFQVLQAIEDLFAPGLGGALSSLPFQNPLAVFLIGLIAGLGLESLLGFFTGRKARAAAAG